jgi:hypothetical protein
MAVMVPDNGKEIDPSPTITLGQKIGMPAKSSRRRGILKRTTPLQESAEPSISEPMIVGMVAASWACRILAGMAMSPFAGID